MRQAGRFGVMSADAYKGRITEFEEKPPCAEKQPRVHGHLHLQVGVSSAAF